MYQDLADVPIVDADSHVVETADLWIDRVPKKFVDQVPTVKVNPRTNHRHWAIGSKWLWPVGFWAQAGWREYPPNTPWEYEEIDPASYDAHFRLKRMDEYGIHAQLLYPNLIGFQSPLIAELGPELSLLCTQVYNDWLLDWASADPQRLIPIAMLPYWDRTACVTEMERCVQLGYRGILFANKFEKIGLPVFCDMYWDPVYEAAQSLDLSVNYHIGFSVPEIVENLQDEALAMRRARGAAGESAHALAASNSFMSQTATLGTILTSGICDRFPSLKFVSVETGFGQIPFYLESLDWLWQAYGNSSELLPSEYFKRQCFSTFFFEMKTLGMLDLYEDNFMFSTDFPHATSLSPGPASPSLVPKEHVHSAFAALDINVAAKALYQNAASLYGIR